MELLVLIPAANRKRCTNSWAVRAQPSLCYLSGFLIKLFLNDENGRHQHKVRAERLFL